MLDYLSPFFAHSVPEPQIQSSFLFKLSYIIDVYIIIIIIIYAEL